MDTSSQENNQCKVGCLVAGAMISDTNVQHLKRSARNSRNVYSNFVKGHQLPSS